MTGILLDVTSEPAKGEMVAWVKRADGSVRPTRAPFVPRFFVAGPSDKLGALAQLLPLVPGVGDVGFEMHALGLGSGRRRVLAVTMRDARRMMSVAQMIDAQGAHRDFDLYDVDLRMSQRFLIERQIFPFARVDDELRALDDPWELDYELPPLRACELKAAVEGGVAKKECDRVVSVTVDDATFDGRDEAAILRDAAAFVRAQDPDVLYTRGGDRWMLAHLEQRARSALGIPRWSLGRGDAGDPPTKRGRSFFQYGHIKYRAPVRPLAGRIHIDLDESFFFTETDIAGVADLARIAGIPLAELARLEAGTAVTAIQIREAKSQGRVIPWKKNLPEKPKTLRSLVKADRGGYIFDPCVGLYDDVIELDFASLYPTLIAKHNLGSETILCRCCEPSSVPAEGFVPQVGYHICQKRRGLVPTVLSRLVKRRADLKVMRKRSTDPVRREELRCRIDALKWLNVVSFGYQGYKNARFGCIEAHEATCAWARETLLTAAEVAREEGYEVLHGIVDSLWLRRASTAATSADSVAEAVERATGIRFEPQGRFDWIVFLPTRMHDAKLATQRIGAPNRFYGAFDKVPDAPSRSQAGQDFDSIANGRVKVRGVEMRQSSAPGVVIQAQEAALNVLATARDAPAFRALVPRALDAARPVVRRLRDGACDLRDLVIDVHVTRGVEERSVMTHSFAALKQLARRGLDVPAGDKIQFVILDGKSRDVEARVREKRLLRGGETYDSQAYETLVVRSLASLFLAVGYDEARIAEEFSDAPRQERLTLVT